MPGEAHIEISPQFDRWIRGFGDLPVELEEEVRRPWQQAADVMFDRSQQFVHVLSGRLKASGKEAEVSIGQGDVTATIEYDAPYAIYEQARGGAHAFLSRAFESTSDLFEEALPQAWERLVATWR